METRIKDYVIFTELEVVEPENFYLTDEWLIHEFVDDIKEIKEEIKEKELYFAYILPAKDYALYYGFDAFQVIIDKNFNIIINCERHAVMKPEATDLVYIREFDIENYEVL